MEKIIITAILSDIPDDILHWWYSWTIKKTRTLNMKNYFTENVFLIKNDK